MIWKAFSKLRSLTMNPSTRALKARYVFPVDRAPLTDGIVTIRDGVITSVGHETEAEVVEDLGNVALLPGLVNAHTHLEFSDLAAPLGEQGMPLPDWIRQVIAYRASDNHDVAAAIHAGMAESTAAGTVAIGEIASAAVPTAAFADAPGPLTAFIEMIGLSSERGIAALANAKDRIDTTLGTRVTNGLSPHAPYSIHVDVVAACGVNQSLPVAMHLAESREELELLAAGTGPFATADLSRSRKRLLSYCWDTCPVIAAANGTQGCTRGNCG
jgi:cytosine/adenosine deaminase-related metal-dependent hydrolase